MPEKRTGAACAAPGCHLLAARTGAFAARATTTPTPAAIAAAGALLAGLARRGVLRPLDELLGRDEAAVLVLLHELQPDAAACLVNLLHEDVEHVAALDHVLDVVDTAGADV